MIARFRASRERRRLERRAGRERLVRSDAPTASAVLLAAALAGLGALRAPTLAAQAVPEVTVGTDRGVEKILLQLPPLGGDGAAADLLRGVVRDDLFFTGLFELVPEGALAPWRLAGSVERGPDGVHVVTVSLEEASSGRPIVAKRFRGSAESLRRIAHRTADEVVRAFTGRESALDTRIAFVSDVGGRRDVYLMDYDGASVSRVTNDGALVLSPEVSADGRLLMFTSYVLGEAAVFAVERETGRMRRLLKQEGLSQSPAFSPDGSRIALSAAIEGNSEIYTCALDGSSLRRLTHSGGIDVSPAWSPTGREIAFQSDRSGTPQVHVMSADGLDVRRLTFEGDFNGEPAYSPDGTQLAFSSRRAGRFQLAILDLASGAVTVITDGGWNHESPSWSPDGEYVAFSSDRGGKYDVWLVRKNGEGARPVGTRGVNRHPYWYR